MLIFLTNPIAIPATCALIGTPAAINAIDPEHIVAVNFEPLDLRFLIQCWIVYGKSSDGITCVRASLNAPCPLRPEHD